MIVASGEELGVEHQEELVNVQAIQVVHQVVDEQHLQQEQLQQTLAVEEEVVQTTSGERLKQESQAEAEADPSAGGGQFFMDQDSGQYYYQVGKAPRKANCHYYVLYTLTTLLAGCQWGHNRGAHWRGRSKAGEEY